MSDPTTPAPAPVPVPYVNTGHPLRDWIAWKIANTQPGQPVFPVLHDALAALIPLLFNMLVGKIDPLSK